MQNLSYCVIIKSKGDDNIMEKKQEEKIKMMLPLLNEKQRRIYLATEAIAMGRGGITEVSRASGISRSVINAGVKDIREGNNNVLSIDAPIRRKGAGRKPITETQPGIKDALEKLVIPDRVSEGRISFGRNGL